jgi:hypothetical protein
MIFGIFISFAGNLVKRIFIAVALGLLTVVALLLLLFSNMGWLKDINEEIGSNFGLTHFSLILSIGLGFVTTATFYYCYKFASALITGVVGFFIGTKIYH